MMTNDEQYHDPPANVPAARHVAELQASCPMCGRTIAPLQQMCACGARLDAPDVVAKAARQVSGHVDTVAPPVVTADARRTPLMVILLATAGVSLLVAAAVIFTAMSWSRMPLAVQAAVLVVSTLGAAFAAIALSRRDLPIVGSALGVLASMLAMVDVVALERSQLVPLGWWVVPLGSLAAAVTALVLARCRVNGGIWTAFVFVVIGVASTPISVLVEMDAKAAGFVAVSLVTGGLLAGTARWWPKEELRALAAGIGVGWLTLAALVHAVAVGGQQTPIGFGVLLFVGLLVVTGAVIISPPAPRFAARLWLLASVSLQGTMAVAALTVAIVGAASGLAAPQFGEMWIVDVWISMADTSAAVAAAVALSVAVVAHVAVRLQKPARWAVLVGAAPAAFGLAIAIVGVALSGAVRGLAVVAGTTVAVQPPGYLLAAVLLVAAAVAAPPVRQRVDILLVVVVATGVATTSASFVWVPAALVAVGLAAYCSGRALPSARIVALLLALASLPLATWRSGWLVAAGLSAAAAAVLVERSDPVVPRSASSQVAATFAMAVKVVAAAAVGVGVMAAATGQGWLPATLPTGATKLAVALVVGHVVLWALLRNARAHNESGALTDGQLAWAIGLSIAGTITSVVVAPDAQVLGLLFLASGAGWMLTSETDLRVTEWVGIAVAAVGILLLATQRPDLAVEVFTLPLAAVLALIGVRRLVGDRATSSGWLWPALTVGIAPSLVLLVADPQVLGRALWMAFAAVFLGAIGVRTRLLAPVLAAAITGVVVALTQLRAVWQVLPRWVVFAVAGALLVALAATYERQRQAARRVRRKLADLR